MEEIRTKEDGKDRLEVVHYSVKNFPRAIFILSPININVENLPSQVSNLQVIGSTLLNCYHAPCFFPFKVLPLQLERKANKRVQSVGVKACKNPTSTEIAAV